MYTLAYIYIKCTHVTTQTHMLLGIQEVKIKQFLRWLIVPGHNLEQD